MSVVLLTLLSATSAHANPYRSVPAAPAKADPFAWQLPTTTVKSGATDKLQLRLVVPSGHEVYRDQLDVVVVDAADLTLGAADFPPGLKHPDPVTGAQEREFYDRDVIVYLPVTAPAKTGERRVTVQLRHQGCLKGKGICYPPVTDEHAVTVVVQ